MPPTDIVCDASVALTWFHAEGEHEVEQSRALLDLHRRRSVALHLLDLTAYEVANALTRGRLRLDPAPVAAVLGALALLPRVALTPEELNDAVEIAHGAGLTVHDAAYAAAARSRRATLVTLDKALLAAGLGVRPSDALALFTR